jgi:LmbE family N-acetylglucosaminyl deacetylase
MNGFKSRGDEVIPGGSLEAEKLWGGKQRSAPCDGIARRVAPLRKSNSLMKSRALLLLLVVVVAFPALGKRPQACCERELAQAEYKQRILIVAPHIDDEAIAAGAYAADAVAGGAEVFIVYLTAGDHSRTALTLNRLTFFASAPLTRKGKTRLAEAAEAASRLGIPPAHVFLLGYPDRGLTKMVNHPERTIRSASTGKRQVPYQQAISPGAPYRLANMVSDLDHVLMIVSPDVIVTPVAHDRHPDHRIAAALVDSALATYEPSVVRLGYIIHTWKMPGLRRSSDGIPVTRGEWVAYALTDDARDRKRDLLRAYRTQRRSPYLNLLFSRSISRYEFFLIDE